LSNAITIRNDPETLLQVFIQQIIIKKRIEYHIVGKVDLNTLNVMS